MRCSSPHDAGRTRLTHKSGTLNVTCGDRVWLWRDVVTRYVLAHISCAVLLFVRVQKVHKDVLRAHNNAP